MRKCPDWTENGNRKSGAVQMRGRCQKMQCNNGNVDHGRTQFLVAAFDPFVSTWPRTLFDFGVPIDLGAAAIVAFYFRGTSPPFITDVWGSVHTSGAALLTVLCNHWM